jgi:hypothetical protein
MIIRSKHIRSLRRHFGGLKPGTKLMLGVRDISSHANPLHQAGFTPQLESGERLLPPATFGKACDRTANGWTIIHKERPKETAYRVVEWHWKQWLPSFHPCITETSGYPAATWGRNTLKNGGLTALFRPVFGP